MTLLGSPSLLHDHGDVAFQHLESMLTSYLTTSKSQSPRKRHALKNDDHPTPPPIIPPPRDASFLLETTTQKMTRHRLSLEKQLLLKQLYTKLQSTKRHGMILLDRRRPILFNLPSPPTSSPPPPPHHYHYHHHHQKKPYQPRYAPLRRHPGHDDNDDNDDNDDDDDDIPLGSLLSHQVKQFHRSGISVT